MVLITLVGETQARMGNRFYFMGPDTECRDCKIKGVCFNLEQGRLYEVTKIRDTHHECEMHDGGVRVVEVEKKPIRACIPRKLAIDGSNITFSKVSCSRMGCEHWMDCHPVSLSDGEKLPVVEVLEKVDCPLGDDLTLVKLG
jgi:uncharacterized protein (UPF0179 family)